MNQTARISLLGLAQNLAHDASSVTPKSLLIRARKSSALFISPHIKGTNWGLFVLCNTGSETRKTYRAVLSEPKLVIPTPQPLNSTPKHPDSKESPQTGHPPSGHNTTNEGSKTEATFTQGKKRGREHDISSTATPEHTGRNKQPSNHLPSDSRPPKKKKGKHVSST